MYRDTCFAMKNWLIAPSHDLGVRLCNHFLEKLSIFFDNSSWERNADPGLHDSRMRYASNPAARGGCKWPMTIRHFLATAA